MTRGEVREERMTVDGVSGPLLVGGPQDSREGVVFVHGNPGSEKDWADLADRVSDFARVAAPCLPGFGQAEKPAGFDYSIDGYAAYVGGVIEQLGLERVHLVLHDFGGPFGMRWAQLNPDRLASAVIINTPGVPVGYHWYLLAKVWRTPVAGELLQATAYAPVFRTLISRGNPKHFPRAEVDRMHHDYDAGTKRAILRLYRATPHMDVYGQAQVEVFAPRRIPALVVWGRTDPYIPVEIGHRQKHAFPDAEVHVLDGSGHWPMLDDPEGVAERVVPFLRSRFAAAAGVGGAR